jgi:hypothetical protein
VAEFCGLSEHLSWLIEMLSYTLLKVKELRDVPVGIVYGTCTLNFTVNGNYKPHYMPSFTIYLNVKVRIS